MVYNIYDSILETLRIKKKNLTLKKNFLSQNCYTCIELNAHSMVLLILHLKEIGKPELFLPHLLGSQPCESMFRQIRSFTSTYSTVANCTVKEILSRISKIQLLSEISCTNKNFAFPNMQRPKKKIPVNYELPTSEDIFKEIEKCKSQAFMDALKFGLVDKRDILNLNLYLCKVKPFVPKKLNKKKILKKQKPITLNEESKKNLLGLSNLHLRDYSHNFKDFEAVKPLSESSPYTEVICSSSKKIIVRKTSLCWFLRKDCIKISSDRLERVKAATKKKQCNHHRFKLKY